MTFADKKPYTPLEVNNDELLQELSNNFTTNNNQFLSYQEEKPPTKRGKQQKSRLSDNQRSSSNPIKKGRQSSPINSSPMVLQPINLTNKQISASKRTRSSSIVKENEL